ncbi:MAG: DUF4352 domain-containing protein [Candidatus Aenigmarchaeota archaeon]|nr:DUF4352 domain-containing protein [Candidatus Aenigmarchaeota archaeon]
MGSNITNYSRIILVIFLLIFISGCLTKLEFQKPIIIKDVSITFDSIMLTKVLDNGLVSDKGYKFVVINITAKNIGTEERFFPFCCLFYPYANMRLEVDRGYRYRPHYSNTLCYISMLRPEEVKKGCIIFEVLEDTYPTRLIINEDYGRFILDIPKWKIDVKGCKYSDGSLCKKTCCITADKCNDNTFSYKKCNVLTGKWESEKYSDSGCTIYC